MIQRTKVLSVPIISACISESPSIILSATQGSIFTATGVHGIITARSDKDFDDILNSPFTYNFPDGMPAVWVAKAKGAKNIERCFGPYIFAEVMRRTSSMPIKHHLCGGREGVAEALRVACARKFGNNNIVGTYCPPFREMSDDEFRELGREIKAKGADVVWIGISTPKQEKFASRLLPFCGARAIITVGAAFDYHTDSIRPAPSWIQNIGMEWFFRLSMEPKRLWRRYAEIVPKFILLGILDIFAARFRANP